MIIWSSFLVVYSLCFSVYLLSKVSFSLAQRIQMMRWLFHNLHALSLSHRLNSEHSKGPMYFGFCRLYPFSPQPTQVANNWNNIRLLSGFKVNLKKMYLYVNSTAQMCSNKISKTFLAEDFFLFSPVLTTPVVHLELRISPRIFEKIWNRPNWILRGLGETDSWKNQKSKISWHCPFKVFYFIEVFWRWQMVKIRRHPVASTWGWRSSETGLICCTL